MQKKIVAPLPRSTYLFPKTLNVGGSNTELFYYVCLQLILNQKRVVLHCLQTAIALISHGNVEINRNLHCKPFWVFRVPSP